MNVNDASSGTMQPEINVTPLIDVLLVLLIIFMVIVPVTSKGEAARAPKPHGRSDTRQDAAVLEVMKDGRGGPLFRINQQPVQGRDLRARLSELYAGRAERVLFIKGDDQISFNEIANAIDVSHAAGIYQVGLITPKMSVEQ